MGKREAGGTKPSLWRKVLVVIGKCIGRVGTPNIVLVVVFGFFLWFNQQILDLAKQGATVPESYACAVIAATLGECGICGWIRTTKDKRRDKEEKNNEPPTDAAG